MSILKLYCFIQDLLFKIKFFFVQRKYFYFPFKHIQRHTYITGLSGSGKSELIKFLIYRYLNKKILGKQYAVILLDPHGDLAEEVGKIQSNFHLRDKIVYIDPFLESGFTPSLNPFDLKYNDEQYIITQAQEICDVFVELLSDSKLTIQMEAILIPCITTLIRSGKGSLLELQRFLDDNNNKDLVELGLKLSDGVQANFFKNFFYLKKYNHTKSSLITRIQFLLNNKNFYNFISLPSSFDLEKEINSKKLIIFNLSKGKLSETVSQAMGRFIISSIKTIVLHRARNKDSIRVPIMLFLDEFQNFLSKSIKTILSEARKYCLHLTAINQIVGQDMNTKLKNLILSCSNVKIVGKNSYNSLSILAKECNINVQSLQKLDIGEFFVNISLSKYEGFKFTVPSLLAGNNYNMDNHQWSIITNEQINKYYNFIDNNLSISQFKGLNVKEKVQKLNQVEIKPKY